MNNLTRIRTQGRKDLMTHDVTGARFDVARRFDRFPLPVRLKAGARLRQEERDLDLTRFDGEAFPRIGRDFSAYVDQRWTFTWPGGLGNIPMPDTRRFFNDAGIRYLPGGAPGQPALKYAYNPAYVVVTDANIIRDSFRDDWRTKDRITAGFLQGEVEFTPKLRGTAGVRFERTNVTLIKPFEDVRATSVVDRWTQRRTFRSDYDNWFPNVQLRYEPWHRVVLRAAYSTTIGRPKITDISGRLVEDDVAQIVTFSNPGLKPQHGRNLDVSAEYYFEPVGVVSVGVFRKEIDNFITPVTFRVQGNEFGLDLREYAGWEGRTKRNVGDGTVEGLEFNYSQQLSFLPGVLKGFGVFANWTTLRSEGDFGELNPPPNVPVKNALPKFRPRSGNVGLSWVFRRWDLRAMWNYTSAYLEIPFLEGTTARDRTLWRGSRKQIDFYATFKLTRRFEVFADVLNIGPSNDSAYFGAVYGPRQRDTTWMSTMLTSGVRAKF
jgi:TonB-dependent receptor